MILYNIIRWLIDRLHSGGALSARMIVIIVDCRLARNRSLWHLLSVLIDKLFVRRRHGRMPRPETQHWWTYSKKKILQPFSLCFGPWRLEYWCYESLDYIIAITKIRPNTHYKQTQETKTPWAGSFSVCVLFDLL